MPTDFLANAKPVRPQQGGDFLAGATPVNTSAPQATLSAAPPESWLHQAEDDFTQGGNRTLLGRTLGRLQGRGDKGYTGIDSGVSKPAANFMGSPVLGLLHAGESAQTIPDHPARGTLGTVGGLLESATIPGMVMGGPEATAAIDAIPSAKHAGEVFDSLKTALADQPVRLDSASAPLNDMLTLGKQGGGAVPVPARQLAARAGQGSQRSIPILRQMQNDLSGISEAQAIPAPILYPEARNFQTGLSGLSRLDSDAMGGPMKGNLRKLNSGLYNDIFNAASQAGRGEDYAQAMKEFRQAAQLKQLATNAAKYGTAAAAGAAGVTELHRFFKGMGK